MKKFLKSSALAALAAGIMAAALPTAAMADPDGNNGRWNRDGRGSENGAHNDGGRHNGSASTSQSSNTPAPQVQRNQQPVTEARTWNGGNGQARTNWQGRGAQSNGAQVQSNPQARGIVPNGAQVQSNWQARGSVTNGTQDRSNWRSTDRDRSGDGLRGEDHRRDNWRGEDRRRDNWRGDEHRNDNWRSGGAGNWSRDWRHDNRYDWRDWRNSHRDTYRLSRYYPPYRGWSYRRLSAGFFLDSLFFSSSYWIDNPWMYRLPEAYGPYRWVRYYDDALLVNIYSGEVVDVIYDFFW